MSRCRVTEAVPAAGGLEPGAVTKCGEGIQTESRVSPGGEHEALNRVGDGVRNAFVPSDCEWICGAKPGKIRPNPADTRTTVESETGSIFKESRRMGWPIV